MNIYRDEYIDNPHEKFSPKCFKILTIFDYVKHTDNSKYER